MLETIFGTIALITSIIGLLPQVIKAIQTRSTADISMFMLINYSICSVAWIVYGLQTHSNFVFFSNILGLVSSLTLIYLKKYFDYQTMQVT
jgi:MtN3 and saliva related transmembrane protein